MAQGAQDAKAALHSIGPDGVGDSEQIAAWIMSFVSFHGAIIKQGVGHGLSNGKRISKYFSVRLPACSRAPARPAEGMRRRMARERLAVWPLMRLQDTESFRGGYRKKNLIAVSPDRRSSG